MKEEPMIFREFLLSIPKLMKDSDRELSSVSLNSKILLTIYSEGSISSCEKSRIETLIYVAIP